MMCAGINIKQWKDGSARGLQFWRGWPAKPPWRGEQVSGQNTEISESIPSKEMAGAKALGPVQKQATRAEGGKKGGGKTTKSEIILG